MDTYHCLSCSCDLISILRTDQYLPIFDPFFTFTKSILRNQNFVNLEFTDYFEHTVLELFPRKTIEL